MSEVSERGRSERRRIDHADEEARALFHLVCSAVGSERAGMRPPALHHHPPHHVTQPPPNPRRRLGWPPSPPSLSVLCNMTCTRIPIPSHPTASPLDEKFDIPNNTPRSTLFQLLFSTQLTQDDRSDFFTLFRPSAPSPLQTPRQVVDPQADQPSSGILLADRDANTKGRNETPTRLILVAPPLPACYVPGGWW